MMKLVAITSSFSDVGCSKHHKALRPAFGGETVQGNVNLIIMIQNMKINIPPVHLPEFLVEGKYNIRANAYDGQTRHLGCLNVQFEMK